MLRLQLGDDLCRLESAEDFRWPDAMRTTFSYSRVVDLHEFFSSWNGGSRSNQRVFQVTTSG